MNGVAHRGVLGAALVLVIAAGGDPCAWEGAGGPTDFRPPAEPADPPWGLDTIVLPDDLRSVGAVFGAFPDGIAGFPKIEGTACIACPVLPCPSNFILDDGVCYDEDGEIAQVLGGSVGSWSASSRPLRFPRRLRAHEVITVADSFDRYFSRLGPGDVVKNLKVSSSEPYRRAQVEGIDLDPIDGLLWIQFAADYVFEDPYKSLEPGPPERVEVFIFGAPDSGWIFVAESKVGGMRMGDLVKGFACAVRGAVPCVEHPTDAT